MEELAFPNRSILWIEEQCEEYDPLLEDLQDLVGREHMVVACTEEEGHSQLEERAFDLVILDLMLPQNDEHYKVGLIRLEAGQRLLRDLRENMGWATSPNCSVLVLTARGNPDALAEVENLLKPSGLLIQKPAPVEEIVQVVREMLEEAQRDRRS
jgi:DNA-binding NarL/FixJ family response regulator